MARIGAFPRIDTLLPRLRAELEEYHSIAYAAVMTGAITAPPSPAELWNFWVVNSIQLPAWFEAARIVALVFVSSASVERIFSLYDSLFGSHLELALEDRREASVMLHFNQKQRDMGR